MKRGIRVLFLAAFYLPMSVPVWAAGTSREIPFTQDDRDRIIRLEIRLEEGQKSLQQQINDMRTSTQRQISDLKTSTQHQFSDLKDFMLWGFSILLAGMFTLVGFVLWDRRTAVAPVQRRQKESDEQQENITKALREHARENPRLAGILKSLNLM